MQRVRALSLYSWSRRRAEIGGGDWSRHACAGPFFCSEYPFEPVCKPGWRHAVAELWQRRMGYCLLVLLALACGPVVALYLYRRKRRRALKGTIDGKGSL